MALTNMPERSAALRLGNPFCSFQYAIDVLRGARWMRYCCFCGLLLLSYYSKGQGGTADSSAIQLKDTAHLFGRDVISNGDFVFNTSFSPDGNTVYFSKATQNWAYIAIFRSARTGGRWTEPVPVPFTGVYRDTDPWVSADGSRLYFCSDRPVKGGTFKDYSYRLFYVPVKDGWPGNEPVEVGLPLPEGMTVLYPSFAANGDLYFVSSDHKTWDSDIYECALVNGTYQAPVRLPFNDAKITDLDPVVSSDERFLIFASMGRKGAGNSDLWVSFRTADGWGAPVNMGSRVNTAGREAAPGLSRDNKTLYFSASFETNARPVYKGGKVTAEAVNRLFHSPANGIPQIYYIDISSITGQGPVAKP